MPNPRCDLLLELAYSLQRTRCVRCPRQPRVIESLPGFSVAIDVMAMRRDRSELEAVHYERVFSSSLDRMRHS